ncbi:S8 family peptidase [Ruminiclostridium josui]|uniref:S8 family peptidase n=1 Tax=Ruminiclostridium josui TaxID=1499 RepID=UPI0004679E77|nr:S8 family serine peptidase [Ruminiclostridium josui]
MDYFYKNHKGYQGIHTPVVAVLDTGVSKNVDIIDSVIYFKDFINNKGDYYDDNGHGTKVCGIITGNGKNSMGRYKGLSDKTDLVVLKIADSNGNVVLASLIDALLWLDNNVEKYNIRIACMSFGFDTINSTITINYLDLLIKNLIDKNVLFVSSAGNRGGMDGLVTFPGSLERVITVGSISFNPKQDKDITESIISAFSSIKTESNVQKPDNYAPGENIIVPCCDTNGGLKYESVNGTSFSAAIFCGQLSIYWGENYSFSSIEMKDLIKRNSKNGILM